MNLYGYWAPPLGKVALAHLLFWSKFVRPLGALYYLPLYAVFGLNPVPFTVVRIAILLLNTVVFYHPAAWLLRSRWMALLATFPIAYDAGMGHLLHSLPQNAWAIRLPAGVHFPGAVCMRPGFEGNGRVIAGNDTGI